MVLNIEDGHSQALVRELSELTGKAVPDIVETALRELLDRERRKERVDRLMKMAQEIAPSIQEPFRSMDHGDILYDELGLPK